MASYRMRVPAVVLAATALAVAIGWSASRSSGSHAARPATLPTVVGERVTHATQRLAALGVHAVDVAAFSSQPAGVVLSQDLPAGGRVAAGTTVTLTVSKGAAHSVMPDVTGLPATVAAARLRSLQLAVLTFVVRSDAPRGSVVSTYPARGASLAYGDQARMNVSGGLSAGSTLRGTVHVPDVVGAGDAAAQSALRARGLTPDVYYLRSPVKAGLVARQTQTPGGEARLGTLVGIGVSLGSGGVATTPVPYVVGRSERAGAALLRSTGFHVRVVSQRAAARTARGAVLDEQPMGGTKAPAHAVVTVVIAA